MKKLLLCFFATVALITFCHQQVIASHLAGHDMTYTLVDSSAGTYHYRVYLDLYMDCMYGDWTAIARDTTETIALFSGTGTLIQTDEAVYCTGIYSMPLTSDSMCSAISSGPALCRSRRRYTKDYYLPASASGYVVVNPRCCLNNSVSNLYLPGQTGMIAYCAIPAGPAARNSTAVFNNYPPLALAINRPLTFDFSATDADGDSLSYELCEGYSAGDISDTKPTPAPPPFLPVRIFVTVFLRRSYELQCSALNRPCNRAPYRYTQY